MARTGYRIRVKTNASIKAHYVRAGLLARQGCPTSLKLTMMGVASRRGGWRLRWEKQRRRLRPFKQLRGTSSTGHCRELEE